jgi:hypothetical protein
MLDLSSVTVESCAQEKQKAFLKLCFLNESGAYPDCQQFSSKLNQNRPVLIRDYLSQDKQLRLFIASTAVRRCQPKQQR